MQNPSEIWGIFQKKSLFVILIIKFWRSLSDNVISWYGFANLHANIPKSKELESSSIASPEWPSRPGNHDTILIENDPEKEIILNREKAKYILSVLMVILKSIGLSKIKLVTKG